MNFPLAITPSAHRHFELTVAGAGVKDGVASFLQSCHHCCEVSLSIFCCFHDGERGCCQSARLCSEVVCTLHACANSMFVPLMLLEAQGTGCVAWACCEIAGIHLGGLAWVFWCNALGSAIVSSLRPNAMQKWCAVLVISCAGSTLQSKDAAQRHPCATIHTGCLGW